MQRNIKMRHALGWFIKKSGPFLKYLVLVSKAVATSRSLNSHGYTVCYTVSLPFSLSHGRFFICHSFTSFEMIFPQTYSFLKKQTQAAHSNFNKERISCMINKNKTGIRSSLSLCWALLFIMLVKTHIGVLYQWKPPSDLLEIARKFTAKCNWPHSIK